MADDTKSAPAPADKPAAKSAPAPAARGESAYGDATHLDNAVEMYGQPRHVIAGALSLHRGGSEPTDLTKSQVAGAVDQFLNHKVESESTGAKS